MGDSPTDSPSSPTCLLFCLSVVGIDLRATSFCHVSGGSFVFLLSLKRYQAALWAFRLHLKIGTGTGFYAGEPINVRMRRLSWDPVPTVLSMPCILGFGFCFCFRRVFLLLLYEKVMPGSWIVMPGLGEGCGVTISFSDHPVGWFPISAPFSPHPPSYLALWAWVLVVPLGSWLHPLLCPYLCILG